jgi:putative SOS response-associated peptidase YedK
MCGRFIIGNQAAIEREFSIVHPLWTFQPSYNVAPTHSVPVIRMQDDQRTGVMLRWGLIPWFAKGTPPHYSTINATIENLERGAAWRGPWSRAQRCIMPASAFYEWHMGEDGKKNPFLIKLADQELFGFAALWDRSIKPDGAVIESCALITMPGNELMRHVHNTGAHPFRMPALLAKEDREQWLAGTPIEAKAALKQYPTARMLTYQVSTRVNSPKNNDAALIDPIDTSTADDRDCGQLSLIR